MASRLTDKSYRYRYVLSQKCFKSTNLKLNYQNHLFDIFLFSYHYVNYIALFKDIIFYIKPVAS